MKKYVQSNIRNIVLMVSIVCFCIFVWIPFPTYAAIAFKIHNPLNVDSLQCLLFLIINGVMAVVAVLAGLYIMFSGFMFVAARGNPEKLKDARKAFLNAVIGTAILLGAWAITSLVVNVLNSVSSKPVITSLPTGANCK